MKLRLLVGAVALLFSVGSFAQTKSSSSTTSEIKRPQRLDCAGVMKPEWNSNQRAAARADCDFFNMSLEKGGDAWGEFAADDATLPRGKGKEEIRKASIALYARSGFRLSWRPDQAQPYGASFVVTSGRWERHIQNAVGKDEVSHGRYVTVWQKQADGSWRFVWDGGEADSAK